MKMNESQFAGSENLISELLDIFDDAPMVLSKARVLVMALSSTNNLADTDDKSAVLDIVSGIENDLYDIVRRLRKANDADIKAAVLEERSAKAAHREGGAK